MPTDRLRPRPQDQWRHSALAVAMAGLLAALGLLAVQEWREPPPAAVSGAVEAALPALDEAAILDRRPERPELVRLAGEERVFVLIFPTLDQQAAAMNRVAALMEKADMPHDRLTAPDELARAIAAHGDTPGTWYLAHDYNGRQLERFFTLAAATGVALSAEEGALRDLSQRMRGVAGTEFALLTMSSEATDLDPVMRAAILRHEVSHGWFFTRPAFAARVREIWRHELSETERDAMVRFLGAEAYDTTNLELVMNEAMAYLAFTPDQRLFAPKNLGIAPERAAAIRALYQAALR